MARGRIWKGIRDWLRPVESTVPPSTISNPPEPSSPRLVHDRTATRAMIDAPQAHDPLDGGAQVIPLYAAGSEAAVLDEAGGDAELLDFLAADLDPVPADPAFRERLREELWEMVVDEGIGVPGGRKDL